MILRFDHVRFSYDEAGTPAVRDLTFSVREGELVLVVGHNGAGKSTLLRLLNGILRPSSGTVYVRDIDTATARTDVLAAHVSVTFQHPSNQIFASTVFKEVLFGPKALHRTAPRVHAEEALRLFHLEQFRHFHPYDLPLAGRKLLTLASAAATASPLLAFDEPSVNLSYPEQTILLDAVAHLRSQGSTFIIVSHDLERFLPISSRVLVLRDGSAELFDVPSVVMQKPEILRRAGIRLPVTFRLRPYVGLNPLPQFQAEEA